VVSETKKRKGGRKLERWKRGRIGLEGEVCQGIGTIHKLYYDSPSRRRAVSFINCRALIGLVATS